MLPLDLMVWLVKPTNEAVYGRTLSQGMSICRKVSLKRTLTELLVAHKNTFNKKLINAHCNDQRIITMSFS